MVATKEGTVTLDTLVAIIYLSVMVICIGIFHILYKIENSPKC
jgi:hypothetical protein